MHVRQFRIAGIGVDEVSTDDVLRFARDRVAERRPGRIVTVNAEYVVRARSDPAFARALASADLATPDGAGVVWAMRRQGANVAGRVGGSDLIWQLSAQAASLGHRVFLLGGRDGVAATAGRHLRQRYPALQVAGTHAGSPYPSDDAAQSHLIRRSGADILFVAYGAPYQDLWIARNLQSAGVAVAIGVGGSFDYVAGVARRAPRWMQDRGLEWLWRLIRQPYRWKRMLALPRFAWLVWRSSGGSRSEGG